MRLPGAALTCLDTVEVQPRVYTRGFGAIAKFNAKGVQRITSG